MQQKLIVISFDAMVYEDLEALSSEPSFSRLMQQGAMVKRVRSIYPTLTYPCHATMRTGCYPEKHGIVNNTHMEPGDLDPRWLWFNSALQCPDLFDACRAAGLTTACIGWPSTGRHPSVDYLVDEIARVRAVTLDDFRRAYLETGTSAQLMTEVLEALLPLRLQKRSLNAEAACAIIRRYQPDFLMLHVAELDAARHKNGVFSPNNQRAFAAYEGTLKAVLEAVHDAGIEDVTNIAAVSDHGQMDYVRSVNPNVLLAKWGCLEINSDKSLRDWRAWCQPGGMSAQIYMKNPEDTALEQELLERFRGLAEAGVWGISRVYDRAACKREHLDGGFSFVLETDGYSVFDAAWTGEYARSNEIGLTVHLQGYHGFHPDKGPRPMFLAMGPAFRTGAVLEEANLVDEAPTFASVLGAALPNADGVDLEALRK